MHKRFASALADFLDQVPLCVTLRPPGEPYWFINSNARDFFSLCPDAIDVRPATLFPDEYAESVEAKDRDVFDGKSRFWFEDHAQPVRDGGMRWINESLFPVQLDGDPPQRVIARFFMPYYRNNSQLPSFVYRELRRVLDALEMTGIFVKDDRGRFAYVNKSLARRLERKRSAILGKTDHELLHSKDQVTHFVGDDQALFAQAKQQGRSSKMTIGDEPLTAPSGKEYVLNTQKQIVWLGNEPRYLVGLANDVTEIRKHQKELERQRAELEKEHRFLNTILSSVSEAMYALDQDAKFLWVNPSLKRLFGLPEAFAVEGLTHVEVFASIDPFARQMQRDDHDAVAPRPFETRGTSPRPKLVSFVDPHGVERQLSILRQRVFSSQDRSFSLVVSIREIPNEWYNARRVIEIFDALPQCVFFKDRNFKFARVNQSFCRWHEKALGQRDFLGKTDYDLWKHRQDLADAFRAIDRKVIETKQQDGPREERHIFENGEERIISTTKFPLFSNQGEVEGIVGIFEDITEAQQELAFRLFREVADDLGHGMKTWINSLENNLFAINHFYAIENGNPIRGAIERMRKVVNQLQTFVNFTVSKTSLENCEYNPTDLAAIIREVVGIFDDPAITCDLPSSACSPHGVKVLGNEFHIKNVIHELISNSLRFRLTTTRIALTQTESHYRVSITDDGKGFDLQRFSFDRYLQGGVSVSITSGHSGMGLAYVKKVIDSHGGLLELKNNGGAQVTFSLPIHIA